MKSNILIAQIAFCLLTIIGLSSCNDDKEFKEVPVTPVTALYEPVSGRIVNLQSTATANLYFEWEKATAADNSLVYYDILFDVPSGDFSNPIYSAVADDRGISTGATITHRTLNRVARMAGIEPGKSGSVKWTVVSSRGLTQTMGKEARELTLVRPDGMEIPDILYVTGPASEGGTDLTLGVPVKQVDDSDIFEVYTELKANEKFYFVDSKVLASMTYSPNEDNTGFVVGDNGGTVDKTGIYRIKLNFKNGEMSINELISIGFFNCEEDRVTNNFSYEGYGIWKITNYNVVFVDKGAWQEDRYKFEYTFDYGVEHWGQYKEAGQNYADGRPSLTNESYYRLDILPAVGSYGDGVFKFPSAFYDEKEMDKTIADVYIYMTADGAYRHQWVEK